MPEIESNSEVFSTISKIALPMILSGFFVMLAEQINFIYVANLEQTELVVAVGLANMLINLFCFSITFGMNSALETLVSQANGAGNKKLCGLWLNRARLGLVAVFPIIVFCLINTKYIIKGMFKASDEVATAASNYVFALLPGLLYIVLFDMHKIFLNSMCHTIGPFVIQAMAVPL